MCRPTPDMIPRGMRRGRPCRGPTGYEMGSPCLDLARVACIGIANRCEALSGSPAAESTQTPEIPNITYFLLPTTRCHLCFWLEPGSPHRDATQKRPISANRCARGSDGPRSRTRHVRGGVGQIWDGFGYNWAWAWSAPQPTRPTNPLTTSISHLHGADQIWGTTSDP